jgi:type II secretory pathway component GspD/PulD (secretin)
MKATAIFTGLMALGLLAQDGAPPDKNGAQPKPEAKQDTPQPKPTAEELRQKAEVEALEAKIRRDEGRITIVMANCTVQQVLEEFRKQINISLVADTRNVPDDFRIPEFKVINVPFREAFNHFLKMSQMVVVEETTNIIRVERPYIMSLTVTDSDVKDVIGLIARVSNANIVIAPDKIIGKVTLTVSNVPWFELLDSVVKTLGFVTVREQYNLIRIITPAELQQQMDIQVFKLRYISPPDSYRAKFEANKYVAGGAIAPPGSIDDIPRFFPFLKVVEASLTKDAGGRMLGTVFYDFERNAIIVKDTRPVLAKIQGIIDVLDSEPDMVTISLKFLTTSNDDLLQWGVAWTTLGNADGGIAVRTRTTPDAPFVRNEAADTNPNNPPNVPSAAVNFQTLLSKLPFGAAATRHFVGENFFLTEYEQTMLFRAFKRDTFTRLLQEPNVTVLDNTPATIFVGENVPYATATLVQSPGTAPVITVAEGARSPVKIGFQLLVLPRILRDENKVILTVIPENVAGAGAENNGTLDRFTLSGQDILLPHTQDSTMVTRLKIEDNQTAVIGGLMTEAGNITVRGIPVLKDIPLLRFLFSDTAETTRKQQLIIFITPKIIRSRTSMTSQLADLQKLREAQVDREIQELRKLREGK